MTSENEMTNAVPRAYIRDLVNAKLNTAITEYRQIQGDYGFSIYAAVYTARTLSEAAEASLRLLDYGASFKDDEGANLHSWCIACLQHVENLTCSEYVRARYPRVHDEVEKST